MGEGNKCARCAIATVEELHRIACSEPSSSGFLSLVWQQTSSMRSPLLRRWESNVCGLTLFASCKTHEQVGQRSLARWATFIATRLLQFPQCPHREARMASCPRTKSLFKEPASAELRASLSNKSTVTVICTSYGEETIQGSFALTPSSQRRCVMQ